MKPVVIKKLELRPALLLGVIGVVAGIVLSALGVSQGYTQIVAIGASLIAVVVVLAGVLWPLVTVSVFTFLFITFHARLEVFSGYFGINPLDLASLLVLVGLGVRLGLSSNRSIRADRAAFLRFRLMLPYIFVAGLLPLVGILIYDFPLTFVVLGLRHFHWVFISLGYLYLSNIFGSDKVIRALLLTLVVSAVFHTLHALIQFLISSNVIPQVIGFVDQFTIANSPKKTWIYHTRTTGFLTNPNNYGILGAVFLIVGVSWYLMSTGSKPWATRGGFGLMLSGSLALILSGSRSALVGAVMGLFLVIGMVILYRNLQPMLKSAYFALAAFVGAGLAILFAPDSLLARFAAFGRIITGGAEAEANVAGRIQHWQNHLENYAQNYPFGTLASPIQALGEAVDSFYVLVIVQGTPIFLVLFGVFAFANLSLGSLRYATRNSDLIRFAGLTLVGLVGVLMGSAVGTGSFHHINLVFIHFPLIGVLLATSEANS